MTGWLVPVIFVIALVYASVGHAGATGYIAAMTLAGLAPEVIRPTALVLNVGVATIATMQFARAGHLRRDLVVPLAAGGVPAAFVGGAIGLHPAVFEAVVGVVLGTAIGVLPGLGPALTIALLLPITYKVDATGAFILFAGIYYGAMYGGSTTSILLNTPGESATIITSLEGNKMARRDRKSTRLNSSHVSESRMPSSA